MKRILILASALFMLTAAGAPAPLTLSVHVARATFDLLDGLNITLAVTNRTKKIQPASFATSDTYDIRLYTPQRALAWAWSDVHHPAPVRKTMFFAPGRTVLVVHVWDATLPDGRTIAPGPYTLHANLTDERFRPVAELPVLFAAPLPVAAFKRIAENGEATVAGTVAYTPLGATLTDASGTIALSRRIGMPAPSGTYVVRGFLTKTEHGDVLSVERFARSFENTGAQPWLLGDYGGAHAGLHAERSGGTMQFDCAHAQFGAVTGEGATLHATGTFTREHGGPVRAGEILPSVAASFTFERRSNGPLAVTIAPSGLPPMSFTLMPGATPQLFRCL